MIIQNIQLMKICAIISIVLTFLSCGNEETQRTGSDSTPTAIDTTQHPNGVTSGSVISTDTAAMKVDTSPENK
jgi:hypothetical protein